MAKTEQMIDEGDDMDRVASPQKEEDCKLWLFEGHTAGLVSMGDEETMLRFLYHSCNPGRYVLERSENDAVVILKSDDHLQPFPEMANVIGWPNTKKRFLTPEERDAVIRN